MRRNRDKFAILALAVGILLIGRAAAYFTDVEVVTNTFTVGNVSLTLLEPNWNPETAKNLVPNQSVPKDPQVKNDGANKEFVFTEVSIPCAEVITVDSFGRKNALAETELVSYTVNFGWTEIGTEKQEDGSILHRYVYGTEQECTALAVEEVTPSLFDTITVANVLEGQGLEASGYDIRVKAYGIQAEHIGAENQLSPKEVWKLLVGPTAPEGGGESD